VTNRQAGSLPDPLQQQRCESERRQKTLAAFFLYRMLMA
jgi:hypothetical protein